MKLSLERILRLVPSTTLVLLAFMSLASFTTPFVSMFFKIPIKYNEGWNAAHAIGAQLGRNIYIPNEYLFNNYPPLSFYVTGWLGHLYGDFILAGRYLSIVSLLVAAFCIFAVIKTITRTNWIAYFACLYFITLMSLEYTQYVGVNCPQMFAQAVSLVSILVFIRHWESRSALFAVAVLTLAAGLIKHNVFAAPVAISIFLYQKDSGLFRFWALSCLTLLTATLILFYMWFGVHFFEQMVSSRVYAVSSIAYNATYHLEPLMVLSAVLVISFSIPLKPKLSVFFNSYLVTAAIVAAFFSGGAGIYYNIYFDLIISLLLLVGIRWHCLREQLLTKNPEWLGLATIIPFALCLPLFLKAPANIHALIKFPRTLDDQVQATAKDIKHIAQSRQPVLCDMLSLCYWAKVPLVYDSFNSKEESQVNKEFENDVLELLRNKHFGLIHIDRSEGVVPVRHTKRFMRTLRRNYHYKKRTGSQHYYAPNER